jgi:hypothetical protein
MTVSSSHRRIAKLFAIAAMLFFGGLAERFDGVARGGERRSVTDLPGLDRLHGVDRFDRVPGLHRLERVGIEMVNLIADAREEEEFAPFRGEVTAGRKSFGPKRHAAP